MLAMLMGLKGIAPRELQQRLGKDGLSVFDLMRATPG